MPKTGEYARESGEYTADWHCTVFMYADMQLPPCPDCGEAVEYTLVRRPVPMSSVSVETLCPRCGRGVIRFPTAPIPHHAVAFCEPHDPWNSHQECRSRFRYDAAAGTGWHLWPVPLGDVDQGRAWYRPRGEPVSG